MPRGGSVVRGEGIHGDTPLADTSDSAPSICPVFGTQIISSLGTPVFGTPVLSE